MGSEDVAQVAEMRARHVRPVGLGYCRSCFQQWPCATSVLLAAYDAQATRLAAVSNALMYAISIVCNVEEPTVTQGVPWEPLRRRFLDQAYAALGPPADKMAPRQELPDAVEVGEVHDGE